MFFQQEVSDREEGQSTCFSGKTCRRIEVFTGESEWRDRYFQIGVATHITAKSAQLVIDMETLQAENHSSSRPIYLESTVNKKSKDFGAWCGTLDRIRLATSLYRDALVIFSMQKFLVQHWCALALFSLLRPSHITPFEVSTTLCLTSVHTLWQSSRRLSKTNTADPVQAQTESNPCHRTETPATRKPRREFTVGHPKT